MKGSNVKESHTLPKFQILAKLNCQLFMNILSAGASL